MIFFTKISEMPGGNQIQTMFRWHHIMQFLQVLWWNQYSN